MLTQIINARILTCLLYTSNLQDFAAVVIINLGVSLLVALFFVPSLIDKTGLKRRKKFSLSDAKWKSGNIRFFMWIRSKMRRFRCV